MKVISQVVQSALSFYQGLGQPVSIDAIDIGLINKTYKVATNKCKFILQELSPIFDPCVNEDSYRVSNYLEGFGIICPSIIKSDKKDLYVAIDNRIFRALSYIEGRSFHTINSYCMAQTAGEVLGSFHHSLIDFNYIYSSQRNHGGAYGFHTQKLKDTLNKHKDHNFFPQVEHLASRWLGEISTLTATLTTTKRHTHGDPKISNILFDHQERALCLIDFDTLGYNGWSLELGDAMRSWANPNKEDVLDSYVDLSIIEHMLMGYAKTIDDNFTIKECGELLLHCQAITLCLAIRYLSDTLAENYFSYDDTRFSRASEHNIIRAQSMYNLYRDFFIKKNSIKEMIYDTLSPGSKTHV